MFMATNICRNKRRVLSRQTRVCRDKLVFVATKLTKLILVAAPASDIKMASVALVGDDGEVLLNVLRCQLTYQGQVVTNAEARFSNSLRPRKPEGSLGRTAQDVHLDSHTAPEL